MVRLFALAIVHCKAHKKDDKIANKRGPAVNEAKASGGAPIVIKKYANRRLYNTATSSYVTLEDLSHMVRAGTDFTVCDAKTGEDITRTVLTQIIFEEEGKGTTLLPINFLRQLIRFYGDTMQAVVPSYLEFSLESLMRDQDKLRKQILEPFGAADPFAMLEDQTKRNVAMFQKAMSTFNPFALAAEAARRGQGATEPRPPAEPAKPREGASQADLDTLRNQLLAMQNRLDELSGGKK
jgi:polyhydroxyalkanoate synthesis repressor PhaR